MKANLQFDKMFVDENDLQEEVFLYFPLMYSSEVMYKPFLPEILFPNFFYWFRFFFFLFWVVLLFYYSFLIVFNLILILSSFSTDNRFSMPICTYTVWHLTIFLFTVHIASKYIYIYIYICFYFTYIVLTLYLLLILKPILFIPK